MKNIILVIAICAAVTISAVAIGATRNVNATASAVKSLFVEHGLRRASFDPESNTCNLEFSDGVAVSVITE